MATVISSGCEAKKATEYVNGISTQMTVPRDIKGVRLQISRDGFVQWCNSYAAYDGKVQLPRSLGNYPANDDAKSASIRFEITGLSETYDPATATNGVYTDCTSAAAVNPANNVRIIRSSVQPYIPNRILFLSLALNYSCYDNPTCPEGQTCKGGTCVSETTDGTTLPDYVDGMGDGEDGACFSVGLCMGAAIPAIPIDDTTCTFALPETKDAPALASGATDPFRAACKADSDCNGGTIPSDPTKARKCTGGICDFLPPSTPWTGLNVQVDFDGGHTKQILDLDKDEGFTIPDLTKPQNFQLAPGLCAMLHGVDSAGKATTHRVTGVRASGVCGPKMTTQAICKADQLTLMGATDSAGDAPDYPGTCKVVQLTPSKAAIAVVVDDTTSDAKFFTDPTKIDAVKTFLADPAFSQADFALFLSPTSAANACTLQSPPFQSETDALTSIPAALTTAGNALVSAPDPSLAGALASAYKSLEALPAAQYLNRGVIVLGNRDWNTDSCSASALGTPAAQAQAALASSSAIVTYPLDIVDPPDAMAAVSNGLSTLAAAGGAQLDSSGSVKLSDIWPDDNDAARLSAVVQAVDRIATCVFDVDPANVPDPAATLTYNDETTNVQGTISPVADPTTCNSSAATRNANAPSGWGFSADKSRVFVCGQACVDYQTALQHIAAFTLTYGQTPLPTPLYAQAPQCVAGTK